MKWRGLAGNLAAWVVASASGSQDCSPCCPPLRMDEPMAISNKGTMAPTGGEPCHVKVFEKAGLHKALNGRWLYFIGDSSTRGLFLALYYELLGAKHALKEAKLAGRTGGSTTLDAMTRTAALFGFGDEASRAECKETLVGLGRGSKWTLEECDDFGDPCKDKLALNDLAGKVDAAVGQSPPVLGDGFGVDDSVSIADSEALPDKLAFLKGVQGEVTSVDSKRGTALILFADWRHQDTGEVFRGQKPNPNAMKEAGYRQHFEVPLGAIARDMAAEAHHRCRKSRGATHSVSSLHLGFVDAGFCNGKLVFSVVSPHDYHEGHMSAPLGAQVFPDRARRFAARMRSDREGACLRLTFRMLPQVLVLVNELEAIAGGAQPGSAALAAAAAGPDMQRWRAAANFPGSPTPGQTPGPPIVGAGDDRARYGDMYNYFKGPSGDSPDLVYLQAGAWDRSMGCLLRRDFVRYFRKAARRLAEAAPGAAFVLGTLPAGSAYPADPTAEQARLVAAETNELLKAKVVLCLKFTPGPVALDAKPEDVARMELLGLPISEGDSEGRHPGEVSLKAGPRGPVANQSDVWVLDREATALALPQGIRLLDTPKATLEFRRLHPAMVQNVWDVQRLVTGLRGTPAFVRGAHAGLASGVSGAGLHGHGNDQTAGGRHGHGHGRGHGHGGGAAHGGGEGGGRRRLESAGGSSCECGGGVGLVVHNPETCAPDAEYTFRLNPDKWPAGYPAKGRLVHWATPCDYSATS